MKKSVFVLLFLILTFNLKAVAAIYSNGNGNWNISSTWVKNGMALLPACGDTVYVQASHTISINSQEDYSGCSVPLYIYVSGTLQFTNGNKLDLPCGSFVNILSGGVVKKATAGGGNSTLISICSSVMWNAAMGPLNGAVYLPVSLIYFQAKQEEDNVISNWATASETNNDYFIVQRLGGNSAFGNIDIVKGAGNSNFIQSYSSIDSNPIPGILYYRLCQVDFNGSRNFFTPSAVTFKKNSEVIVYPNPASKDYVSIIFNAEAGNRYTLELTDASGKLIFKKEDRCSQSGFNTLKLNNYYTFSQGIYFITFRIKKVIHQGKIIIT